MNRVKKLNRNIKPAFSIIVCFGIETDAANYDIIEGFIKNKFTVSKFLICKVVPEKCPYLQLETVCINPLHLFT